MRESKKGKKPSKSMIGANNRMAKSVLCINTGIIYGTIQEAVIGTGVYRDAISRVCNSKINDVKGLMFKFVDNNKSLEGENAN